MRFGPVNRRQRRVAFVFFSNLRYEKVDSPQSTGGDNCHEGMNLHSPECVYNMYNKAVAHGL